MRSIAISCAHIGPGQSLQRFHKLGEYIAQTQPDNIIQLGDFVTLDSLSLWDHDKRALLNGRYYYEEVQVGRTAIKMLIAPLLKLRSNQQKTKKKIYRPNIVWCLGNHEDRVYQYLLRHPEVDGQLNLVHDLGIIKILEQIGKVNIVPYREQYMVGGVAFTHAIINAAGKPLGGKTVINRSLDLLNRSTVFGHTHRLVYDSVMRYGGQVQALSIGTFSEHTDHYATERLTNYYRGFVNLYHVGDGHFDFEPIRLERLYGT